MNQCYAHICLSMASDGAGLRLMDGVSCSICMEQFDIHLHVPKILPCQHTFCLICPGCMSNHQMTIVCPVCREEIYVPANGYTTNRAVLDIVEELQKDASSDVPKSSTDVPKRPTDVMKCLQHSNAECMLLCIDCLEGLCLKCIKLGSHHSHKLEEPSDAKYLLKLKFDEQIRNELLIWDAKMSAIKQSAYSVAGITQAEEDFKTINDKITNTFKIWRNSQQTVLQDCKQQAISRENEIQIQRGKLQSLLEHNDINISDLITKLKEPHSIEHKTRSSNDMDLRGAQAYNFKQQSETFLRSLQQVVLCSKDTFTSNYFKQACNMKSKEGHSKTTAGCIDRAVNTSDFARKCLKEASDVKLEEVHQHEPVSRGIDEALDTTNITETKLYKQDENQSHNSAGSIKNKSPAGIQAAFKTSSSSSSSTTTTTATPTITLVNATSVNITESRDISRANTTASAATMENSTPKVTTTYNVTTVNKDTVNATVEAKPIIKAAEAVETTTSETEGIMTTINATESVNSIVTATEGVKTTVSTTAQTEKTTVDTAVGAKTTMSTAPQGNKTTVDTVEKVAKETVDTTEGAKTTVYAAGGVKRDMQSPENSNAASNACTVSNTVANETATNEKEVGNTIKPEHSRPSGVEACISAKEINKPRKSKDIKIDKVVDTSVINQGLIIQIKEDVIYYNYNSRGCTLYAVTSPRRKRALHYLNYYKDVQFNNGYKKHIDLVKEYYFFFIITNACNWTCSNTWDIYVTLLTSIG